MTVFLVGGGVDTMRTPGLLGAFLDELDERGRRAGRRPRLAVVLVDEEGSGQRFLPEYTDAWATAGTVEVEPFFIRGGSVVSPDVFGDVEGIAVAGGPAPAYLDGLSDAGDVIREQVRSGVPYIGFSAGAMIAAASAIVGGYRMGSREVCPEEWAEGLDPVTVRPGLGLVPFTVEVHAAQAGTLGRAVALVQSGEAPGAVAIDEDTCLAVRPFDPLEHGGVSGSGSVWTVALAPGGAGALVTRR